MRSREGTKAKDRRRSEIESTNHCDGEEEGRGRLLRLSVSIVRLCPTEKNSDHEAPGRQDQDNSAAKPQTQTARVT